MNGPKRKILLVSILGILVCTVIVLTGPQPLEAEVANEKPSVTISPIKRASVAREYTAYGILRPRQILSLASQVDGEVNWVNLKLSAGHQVDKGEDLFHIDSRDFVFAVDRVRASYALALYDIELEQGRSDVARLEWNALIKKENGEQLSASRLRLREPQQGQSQAQLDIAEAELETAKLTLSRTKVKSPWPASVIEANAVVGQILKKGESIATLFPIDFAWVEVQVPPQLLLQFNAGIQSIELRPSYNLDAIPIQGKLDGIVPNLSEQNRLVTIRVRVERPLTQPGWVFGMHLQARLIAIEKRDVTYIPHEMVIAGNLVWVYRNGHAIRHQVFPIGRSNEFIQVENNFQAEDRLIIKRPIGLFANSEVEASEV